MQYPLISEYVRAIQDASSNLDKLAHLVPVLDDHGEPYRSSGAFAVVFKMKDEQTGECYALKCFTEEQEGRAEAYRKIAYELECLRVEEPVSAEPSYITTVKYFEKEIFVDSSCEEDEFPVLLMDWIDGETMESYIAENYRDNYTMAMLCYRFCKMAAWLRSQPFAHGDIKLDNIMVRPDGSLVLVDYDGMFVPAMKGQKSPTVGTKDFSHPQRTVDDFDETIDDFALASIALSLKAISLKPSLFDEYGAADRLLFSAEDYRNPSNSKVISALQELMCDNDFCNLYSLFLSAMARKELSLCSFRLFLVEKPGLPPARLLTEVTDEDLENALVDEWGVKYSKDGRRLLKVPTELRGVYHIREGVRGICDEAFTLSSLADIVIPNSVRVIGGGAFMYCRFLTSIVIPNSVTSIEGNPFVHWNGVLKCLSSYFVYEDGVLFDSEKNKIIAFRKNTELYVIPPCVTSIGESAFEICSLTKITIPDGVATIGNRAFEGCSSLSSIDIPNSVTSIGTRTFFGCSSLTSIVIPNSVTSIGNGAFRGCRSLSSIVIPNSVTSIGKEAFGGCSKLSEQQRANIIQRFGKEVFE